MKEMVQRQKDAVFSLGIEFSIKHPLFALLARHNKLLIASQKLQLLEQLIAKLSDFDRCSNLSNIDEGVRKIAANQITASDLNTFTNTFLSNMRMKFVMTTT